MPQNRRLWPIRALARTAVAEAVNEAGIVAAKGRAGTVFYFDGEIYHSSPPNMSPFQRSVLLLSYNRVDNAPPTVDTVRPAYLCAHDRTPLVATSEYDLARHARVPKPITPDAINTRRSRALVSPPCHAIGHQGR